MQSLNLIRYVVDCQATVTPSLHYTPIEIKMKCFSQTKSNYILSILGFENFDFAKVNSRVQEGGVESSVWIRGHLKNEN